MRIRTGLFILLLHKYMGCQISHSIPSKPEVSESEVRNVRLAKVSGVYVASYGTNTSELKT